MLEVVRKKMAKCFGFSVPRNLQPIKSYCEISLSLSLSHGPNRNLQLRRVNNRISLQLLTLVTSDITLSSVILTYTAQAHLEALYIKQRWIALLFFFREEQSVSHGTFIQPQKEKRLVSSRLSLTHHRYRYRYPPRLASTPRVD